jgi:hypothetical protein
MNDNDRMVLENRIRIKDWVIEQHKLALHRIGDAIATGDSEVIFDTWMKIRAIADRKEE